MSEICIIVTIVVYLAAMLLVGFAYSKTNNDSTDFYLGGRKTVSYTHPPSPRDRSVSRMPSSA